MTITKRLVKGTALTHAELDGNFTDFEGQLATKSATGHTHLANNVTDFSTAVAALITGKSDTSHTHASTAIADFNAAVDARIALSSSSGGVVEVVTAASRTLGAADANKTLVFTNTGAITVTLPTAADGISVDLLWYDSTGTITLVPSGTTVNEQTGNLVLSAPKGAISLTPIAGSANTWIAIGSIGELTAADISDSTAAGRAVLTAADVNAQRTAMGAAGMTQYGQLSFYVPTVSDADLVILPMEAHAGTITKVTTDCASGTCTLTTKINSTALGGTANNVSSTKTSQSHTSANTWAVGDDLVFTASANSSCLGLRVTVTYTRSMA